MIPAPAYLAKAAREAGGEQYPCQGGRCSCSSAHECWTSCLCKTGAEKVAWAHEHGVAIPSYADLTFVVSGPEPAAPACPLCAHDEGADEDVDMPVRRVATLSPLGCKGLDVLSAIGVVTSVRVRTGVVIPHTPRALAPASDAGWCVVSRLIEIEPPPPRVRAA
ncbi:MAG: hypothetical protein DHS20C14_04000 [Phycisphaeraceae bacterium]|nr:MAG: hypothetical protein DHS20C14_04000 [Phycisphaeraceae bacterium]